MGIRLGPVLGFRGASDGVWNVSALVTVDDGKAPAVTLDAPGTTAATGKKLGAVRGERSELTLWRFDFGIKQGEEALAVTYTVGGDRHKFHVPPIGVAPRMAYGSCNGFSSLKLLKSTKNPNALWKDVLVKHGELPFHLLLLGGDQLYSDSIWEEIRPLADWAALPVEEGAEKKPTAALRKRIDRYYYELYPRRWAQREMADALATIPSVMMWDDHDIFDGWGSYPDTLQRCPVYQAIFRSARSAFSLYQLQIAEDEQHPLTIERQNHFSLGCQIGDCAILALDMRDERSSDQVMSPQSWKAIYEWLDEVTPAASAGGVKHLFVLSSIPVVYPDFQLLENALGLYPGRQELEDDLRDHWSSSPHRQERLRLIHRLLAFCESKQCRVTILSGDVHVGAVGVIRSERSTAQSAIRTINQLTSSGIVHPAPPGMVLFFLEHVVGKAMNDDSGVTSEIVEIPGTHHHFIGARNWLALRPDQEGRYWANWHIEGEKHPFTKVVHPVGFKMPQPKLPEEAAIVAPSTG